MTRMATMSRANSPLRRLEHLRRALKTAGDGRGQVHVRFNFLQLFDGGAERHAGREVERDGDGRQLADVRNARRAEVARELGDGAQGHEFGRAVGAGDGTGDVKLRERVGIELKLRLDFKDDPVFGHVGVNRGRLPFAEGVVKRVFDLLRRDAERGGLVAVNLHVDLRAGDLQIAGHILKRGRCLRHFPHQHRRPVETAPSCRCPAGCIDKAPWSTCRRRG